MHYIFVHFRNCIVKTISDIRKIISYLHKI